MTALEKKLYKRRKQRKYRSMGVKRPHNRQWLAVTKAYLPLLRGR